MSDLRGSCVKPFARSGDRYSGVPYARVVRNASGESGSYFSEKPKSTRVGIEVDDNKILAGLREA